MTRHCALLAVLLLAAPSLARAELRLQPPALGRTAAGAAPRLLEATLAAPRLQAEPPRPRRSALWATVPFGVGQFANQQPLKGTLFFAAETLAFGTFAGTLAAFEVNKVRGELFAWGEFRDPALAHRLETASLIAFWSGVGIAALGVLDAFYCRPGEQPQLSFAPNAVAVRF